MSDFYKGDDQLLYLIISSVDKPIICLTENSMQENVEMIETTTVDNAGWKTSRPLNQSYTISFTGIQVITEEAVPDNYSYDTLVVVKRARTRIEWKKKVDGIFEETGEGYITELSETAAVGDLLVFSGTIEGYGSPTIVDVTDSVYEYEDGTTYIFND